MLTQNKHANLRHVNSSTIFSVVAAAQIFSLLCVKAFNLCSFKIIIIVIIAIIIIIVIIIIIIVIIIIIIIIVIIMITTGVVGF